jgi:uncharacterized damage-inducible protein DinB
MSSESIRPDHDRSTPANIVITPEALLEHWQGHRSLTRRVIEAFPEHELFHYSVGGMRPFSALALEMISMAGAGTRGVATGNWTYVDNLLHHAENQGPGAKAELLRLWDQTTDQVNVNWALIRPGRFQEIDTAFGQWEGPIYGLMLYWIDNEIHHRGQGYVYLRSLGIEPPPFYVR